MSHYIRTFAMAFETELDREEDGRRIAEVVTLPGVLVYGNTQEQARARAKSLAQAVIAEQQQRRYTKG